MSDRVSIDWTARSIRIIPDRIEAGTFLIAGAITRATCVVTGCVREHLAAFLHKLEEAGASVKSRSGNPARVMPAGAFVTGRDTEEYPGFATDLQAQYMA